MIFTKDISSSAYPTDSYANILKTQKSFTSKFNINYDFNPNASNVNNQVSKNKIFACVNDTDIECANAIKQSILKVSIFYSDLSYTHVEESAAISVDALIGVIGWSSISF